MRQNEIELLFSALREMGQPIYFRRTGATDLGQRTAIGITYDTISHDVASWTHPADHLGCFNQRTKVWIVEQQVRRDDGSVGGVTRWRWFVGSANDVFAGKTLDAVGADDEVCVNDFAGFEGQSGYRRFHGDNTAIGANGDARMRLRELIDEAMKVGSLYATIRTT